MIQGVPGAGKSELLKWIRALFEMVLEWQRGMESAFIPSMHTMAVIIDGVIIRSFGDILVGANKSQAKKSMSLAKPDSNKMWERIRYSAAGERG